MNAIYFLIPLTIVLLVVAIVAFFWAVNSNQYSDLDKEAHQILFEDDPVVADDNSNNQPDGEDNPSASEEYNQP